MSPHGLSLAELWDMKEGLVLVGELEPSDESATPTYQGERVPYDHNMALSWFGIDRITPSEN